jgi:hypothetical protein
LRSGTKKFRRLRRLRNRSGRSSASGCINSSVCGCW